MPRIENQTIEFHDMQSVLGQKFGGNCQIITANKVLSKCRTIPFEIIYQVVVISH
jgi:hypothetical protein